MVFEAQLAAQNSAYPCELVQQLTNLVSRRRAHVALANETQEELSTLKEWLDTGVICSSLDKTLPLRKARQAHELVEREERVGSIVLSLEEAQPEPR